MRNKYIIPRRILTATTESLAASANISAQETTLGQRSSNRAFTLSMIS